MGGNKDKLLTGTAVVAIAVLALVAVAGAEKPVSVQAGNVVLRFNAGFPLTPVSRTVPTPTTFTFSTSVRTPDGYPPALTRLRLEVDKDSAVDVRGLPTCGPKVQRQGRRQVEQACAKAIVGSGFATFAITPSESPKPGGQPIPADGRMVISNGGVRGAVTTLYAHTDISFPAPAAVVFTIKIRKPPRPHAGSEVVISVPKIAGGSGSLFSFSAAIGMPRSSSMKRRHIVTLMCPDRKVRTQVEASFADGTDAAANLVSSCTPRP